MRSETDAVLVGGETYRQDAPQLTARVRGGRNPGRVILTSRIAGVARSGRFLKAGGRVIVAAPRGVSREEADRLRSLGIRVLLLPTRKGRIEASVFLDALGREGITSLHRYVFFLAPLLLGEGVRSIAGFAAGRMKEGRRLLITSVKRAGSDIMVVAEPASAV
jgi:diaminohydroxyphosphoribosylaminopyrimidine deaminase/5-amino-6-(5-phosphoribosylamino)uracil reductase